MTQATFGIAITGENKTDKGAKAAERRLSQIPRHVGVNSRRFAAEGERTFGRSTKNILRTFGQVEQAGARVFGGRSLTSGIAGRLGGITSAASAAGTGLGEAAAAGGVLSTTLGVIGVAAGATVGVLAAAAYGAFRLADGWAKGAASLGRTAETIGVATQAMQEFGAAAERAGVDKDKATGSLGGLSQTLNDARYGRNPAALEVLRRLGVRLQLNKDGTVDVGAMLPAIADAIAGQNSSGRRTVASNLGISLEALPAFTQGGKQLAADMVDADTHAPMISDAEIATAKRIARKGAMVGQLKDRGVDRAGKLAAEHAESGYDATLQGGQAIVDGASDFRGAVDRSFRPSAEKIDRAADRMVASLPRGQIGMTREAVAAAHAAEHKHGVPSSVQLGQYQLESGGGRHMPPGSNNPFGIKARRGDPFVTSPTWEVIDGRKVRVMARFRKFNSLAEAFDEHAKLLAHGRAMAKARRHGYDVDRYVEELGGGTASDPRYATDPNYGRKMRSIIHNKGLDRFDNGRGEIPVRVEIDMRGAPSGTRTKVTAGSASKPAVSHAYEPVRGG